MLSLDWSTLLFGSFLLSGFFPTLRTPLLWPFGARGSWACYTILKRSLPTMSFPPFCLSALASAIRYLWSIERPFASSSVDGAKSDTSSLTSSAPDSIPLLGLSPPLEDPNINSMLYLVEGLSEFTGCDFLVMTAPLGYPGVCKVSYP